MNIHKIIHDWILYPLYFILWHGARGVFHMIIKNRLSDKNMKKRIGTNPICANCEYFINEDGMPYCAVKGLYTEARAEDKACMSFTPKTEKK